MNTNEMYTRLGVSDAVLRFGDEVLAELIVNNMKKD